MKPTIADGIAVRRVGELTLPLIEKYVDEVVVVEEEEIASGILTLLEREKTLAEGAGAAAVAAFCTTKPVCKEKRQLRWLVVEILTSPILSRIIERGLVKDGRLVRMKFICRTVRDHFISSRG